MRLGAQDTVLHAGASREDYLEHRQETRMEANSWEVVNGRLEMACANGSLHYRKSVSGGATAGNQVRTPRGDGDTVQRVEPQPSVRIRRLTALRLRTKRGAITTDRFVLVAEHTPRIAGSNSSSRCRTPKAEWSWHRRAGRSSSAQNSKRAAMIASLSAGASRHDGVGSAPPLLSAAHANPRHTPQGRRRVLPAAYRGAAEAPIRPVGGQYQRRAHRTAPRTRAGRCYYRPPGTGGAGHNRVRGEWQVPPHPPAHP